MLEFAEARWTPLFKGHVFEAGELLMPVVHLTDQFVDAPAFHAEVGMGRRPFDFRPVILQNALGREFLIPDVVDDGVDIRPIQDRMVREKLHDRLPERLVFETFAERTAGDFPRGLPAAPNAWYWTLRMAWQMVK